MSNFANADRIRRTFPVSKPHNGKCPLRIIAKSAPAQHVKKSLLTIYMTAMIEVFSHSSWNGW
jgi:hypothetical protein